MLSHTELILRIVVGAALGGVIGYERDRHGRPAGLRTHTLVALASATFMVVSTQFAYYQRFGPNDLIEVDASRIAASVVSAVGFLAGGSILRSGVSVQGLTTAAGLWLVTAIGLCSGAGMLVEASTVTAVGIIALTLLRRFEDKDDRRITRKRVTVLLGEGGDSAIPQLMAALTDLGAVSSDVEYERRLDDNRSVRLVFDMTVPVSVTAAELIEVLERPPSVLNVHIRSWPE
ncbi:MAG TPA: MgtC/SapB family protein [Polyangiales bacterium]|jgi:putative Mg2+ transporter-C (MgtC) family protein|nr:MgtC/SapB family protein [Polyangiales bacterium]